MKICGIDPSMNSSGKCIMELGPNNFSIIDIKFYGYNSVKIRCINEENVNLTSVGTKYLKSNMFDRQNIAYEIINEDMDDVKHVAFEGYAYGATKTNSIFQIGEFIGGMKKMFYDAGKGIMIYPPSVIKRFATGSGSADKTQMSAMFKEEYPQLYPKQFDKLPQNDSPHSDLCDAFWIAEVLRTHIIYDTLGAEALTEGKVTLIEHKSSKKIQSISETKIIKKL